MQNKISQLKYVYKRQAIYEKTKLHNTFYAKIPV